MSRRGRPDVPCQENAKDRLSPPEVGYPSQQPLKDTIDGRATVTEHLDAAIAAPPPHGGGARDNRGSIPADTDRPSRLSRAGAAAFMLTVVVVELVWFACLSYGTILLVSLLA